MRQLLTALLVLAMSAVGAASQPATYIETPSLAGEVARGALPRVAERLPETPLVVAPETAGQHGGELRLLMSGAKDTRLMVVYGYARLVKYTPEFELVPDIAERIDVEGDRVFTFHLRKGHKWSDGKPFTSEDFRYWFEDMKGNDKLSPSGLPLSMLVDGEKPKFEIPDAHTVRYSWSKPNRLFLRELAQASPLYIYAPAHYLKKFHIKYGDAAKLEERAKKAGQQSWAGIHNRYDDMYKNNNPELPTLDPWVLTTKPPSDRFVFVRNPFFHKVDANGRQLPYIDRVGMPIADGKIIPLKTGSGEADLQARYLRFDNYTFLKEAETRNDYTVHLWRTGPGAQLALYPNLNTNDAVWRELFRDVRFRRALSLAVDRHEINQAIYYGLAIEGQNTVLPNSPLYKKEYRENWSRFDVKQARKLLDEIGLRKKNSEGIRLLPDGRPMTIIVETAGESTEQTDVLELVRDSWRQIGIKLFTKPSQREVFRNRIFSGETLMSIDKGVENGLVTAAMPPLEFAPSTQTQLMWPRWGQHIETKGKSGEPIADPAAQRLRELLDAWFDAEAKEQQAAAWHEMLRIWSDQVYSIGIIAGVLQPVVVNNKLRNVPEKGFYNWDPGAHFGMYQPDTFWFDRASTAEAPK
jgi:peptide/nickel transport system substrate-binding protein